MSILPVYISVVPEAKEVTGTGVNKVSHCVCGHLGSIKPRSRAANAVPLSLCISLKWFPVSGFGL